MKMGLIHGDYWPDNAGLRYGSREPVVFDLEHVAWGPRFADVARWIGPPDGTGHRHFPQRLLARIYLDEYTLNKGPRVPLAAFLEETRALWVCQLLEGLGFRLDGALDSKSDWTEDRETIRHVFRKELRRDLRALLRESARRQSCK